MKNGNENTVRYDILDHVVVSTIRLNDPLVRVLDPFLDAFSFLQPDRPYFQAAPAIESEYETMVFPAKDGEITSWGELACQRWKDEGLAIFGHALMVEEWKSK